MMTNKWQHRTKIVRQMCRQIFCQMKQKAECILCVCTSIFVKYDGKYVGQMTYKIARCSLCGVAKYQRLPFKLVAAYQNGGIHSGCGQLCYAHLQSEFLRSISTEEFFMYYVPIEMTKEYVSSNEIYDKVNGELIRITADMIKVIVLQGKLTEVYFAEVESEEMYHELMRPIWREEKALQRNKKCAVRNENGKLIRCDGNCSTCSHSQSRSQISLEAMEKTGGFRSSKDGVHHHIDPATYSKSTEDIVMDAVLLEELFMQISMLFEENQKIITMFREGVSERDIAKAVGLSQKGVNKRKKAIFDDLRKKLKNFF